MKRYYFPIFIILMLAVLSTGYVRSDQRDDAIIEIISSSAIGLFGVCSQADVQARAHCAAFQAAVMERTMNMADQFCCLYYYDDDPNKPAKSEGLNWLACPPGDLSKEADREILVRNFLIYWTRDADIDRLEDVTPVEAVQEATRNLYEECIENGGSY